MKAEYNPISFKITPRNYSKGFFKRNYFKRSESDKIIGDMLEQVKKIENKRSLSIDYKFGSDGRIIELDMKTKDDVFNGCIEYKWFYDDGLHEGYMAIIGNLKFSSKDINDKEEYLSLIKILK